MILLRASLCGADCYFVTIAVITLNKIDILITPFTLLIVFIYIHAGVFNFQSKVVVKVKTDFRQL